MIAKRRGTLVAIAIGALFSCGHAEDSSIAVDICHSIPDSDDPRPFSIFKARIVTWGTATNMPAFGKFQAGRFSPVTLEVTQTLHGVPPMSGDVLWRGDITATGQSEEGPLKDANGNLSGYFFVIVTNGNAYVSSDGYFRSEGGGILRNQVVYARGIAESDFLSEVSRALEGCPAVVPSGVDGGP